MNNGFENNERDEQQNASPATPSPEAGLYQETPPAKESITQQQAVPPHPQDNRPSYSQTSGYGSYAPPPNSYGASTDRNPYAQMPYGAPQGGYAQGNVYRPTATTPYTATPNGYYHNNYAPPAPAPIVKEKKGASKGFVVGMVALGMAICLLIGAFSGAALYSGLSGNRTLPAGDGSVIVQHESKGETPVITDKGNAAYVASIAADAVVEVSTETVSTDSYFGQYVTQGAGSGVIISSGDGGSYIITCAHVIEGATTVTVKLKDGTEYKATFAASDTQTDIGVIKIDVMGLTVATIADFSNVVVGEEVVAIGNPLGELGGSVTNGIVSALDRDVIIDGTAYHLLQTNAEINPGNSGGGLFNMEGKLIGVVNAKSAGENIEGLGFAIPIDDAMEIATELIENGYVTGRVQLGVEVIEIQSQADAQYWWQYSRYFTDYGIYIINAENDQLKTGDRLVAIDSVQIKTTTELKAILLEYEVGDTVTLTVSRINNNTGRAEMIDIELVLTEKTA